MPLCGKTLLIRPLEHRGRRVHGDRKSDRLGSVSSVSSVFKQSWPQRGASEHKAENAPQPAHLLAPLVPLCGKTPLIRLVLNTEDAEFTEVSNCDWDSPPCAPCPLCSNNLVGSYFAPLAPPARGKSVIRIRARKTWWGQLALTPFEISFQPANVFRYQRRRAGAAG